jgi:hypothetical protein
MRSSRNAIGVHIDSLEHGDPPLLRKRALFAAESLRGGLASLPNPGFLDKLVLLTLDMFLKLVSGLFKDL